MYADTMPILKIAETRVWRTYEGGKNIDKWHKGKVSNYNKQLPEDWIASIVQATNPGRSNIVEGLSRVINLDGEPYLKNIIEKNTEKWLGVHYDKLIGNEMGILVKLIDAGERLTIQVHPDKQFAKEVLNSDYGKTESWFVLKNDDIDKTYIYLGFKEHVTRDIWKRLFEKQDIPGMLSCLHKIKVEEGDAFIIEGGVPHAIGEGCFLLEIQEPTDFTMRTELVTPNGFKITEQQCHQGVGFEKMLDCFHYNTYTIDETIEKWKVKPTESYYGNNRITSIIDRRYTDLFSVKLLSIKEDFKFMRQAIIGVYIVMEGSANIVVNGIATEVEKGDYFIVSASVKEMDVVVNSNEVKIIEAIQVK